MTFKRGSATHLPPESGPVRASSSDHSDSPYRWVMLAAVWLIYFSFGLVTYSIAPLVNVIVHELEISLSRMGTILGAWQFIYLFTAIPLGFAVDKFGLRRSLAIGVTIIAASAFLRGTADSATGLWLAVAVFGVGGPLISIGAPKVISQWFGSQQRGMAMGIYMTGPALGGIASLTLTNSVLMPLIDNQWRLVFLIIGSGVLLCGAFWFAVNLPAVSQSHARPKTHTAPADWSVFARLLKVPVVAIVLLMSIAMFVYLHGLSSWMPAILRSKGMSASTAGFWASIPPLAGIVASLMIPRYAIGRRLFTLLICASVAALLSTLLLQSLQQPVLLLALVLQGIAASSLVTLSMLVLMESPSVGSHHMGAAGGLFFTSAQIGGVSGPVGIGFIADLFGGFSAALAGVSMVCLVLICFSVLVSKYQNSNNN